MKLTKEQVEKAIEQMDTLVEAVIEHCGKFGYTRELPSHWGQVRETVARISANILAGEKPEAGKTEQVFGYPSSPQVVERTPTLEIARKSTVRLVIRPRAIL